MMRRKKTKTNGLLTKCEVKLAGNWPSSFLRLMDRDARSWERGCLIKFAGVSSKHLRVFLESLRQSSDILENFRKFSENVRERSSGLRNNFGKSSKIFGK